MKIKDLQQKECEKEGHEINIVIEENEGKKICYYCEEVIK